MSADGLAVFRCEVVARLWRRVAPAHSVATAAELWAACAIAGAAWLLLSSAIFSMRLCCATRTSASACASSRASRTRAAVDRSLSVAPNHVSRVGEYPRSAVPSGDRDRVFASAGCFVCGDDTHGGRPRPEDRADADKRGLPTDPPGLGHALDEVGDAGSSALSSRRRIRSAYAACTSFVGVPGEAAPPLTAKDAGTPCALRSLRRRLALSLACCRALAGVSRSVVWPGPAIVMSGR